MKKTFLILTLFISIFLLSGCNKEITEGDFINKVNSRDIETVQKYINSKKIANREYSIDTALVVASKSIGNIEIPKILIEAGANINTQRESGYNALLISSLNGNLELAKLLIKNGADVNIQTDKGETPLRLSSRNGHRDIVKLLLENGAIIDKADNSGMTPLMSAVLNGDIDIARELINRGADYSLKDNFGFDSNFYLNAHSEMMSLILKRNNNSNIKSNNIDINNIKLDNFEYKGINYNTTELKPLNIDNGSCGWPKPLPKMGCKIGDCVNGEREQICESNTLIYGKSCGFKPLPKMGCKIGDCVNGQWQQICN